MMGSEDCLGVIPRAIHDIFQRIKKVTTSDFLAHIDKSSGNWVAIGVFLLKQFKRKDIHTHLLILVAREKHSIDSHTS